MQWALLAIIVIALFLLSGRHPKWAFGLFGALVVTISALLFFSQEDAETSRGQIDPEDVTVENIVSLPAYGGSYRLAGRIQNHHSHAALKEVVLSIIMQDCEASGCLTVGQTDEQVNLRVPPGQARDFSITVYLGEADISGTIGWNITVTTTRS